MLKKWLESCSGTATYESLAVAFEQVGRTDLAAKYCNVHSDPCKGKCSSLKIFSSVNRIMGWAARYWELQHFFSTITPLINCLVFLRYFVVSIIILKIVFGG